MHNSLDADYNQELVRHWRDGKVWERAADPNVVELHEGYAPSIIIDAPKYGISKTTTCKIKDYLKKLFSL